jgi:glycosyltransferase involved in cell wall biosynthesis
LLSAVFPVFNEEDNVGPLLTEALDTLGRFADQFEIVVVDDGSQDRTAEIVRSHAERRSEVRLVAHPTNLGYGHAMRSGLAHSRGDAVAWIDGDRQFRVADLALLFGKFGDADIVAGRRIQRADPWHRIAIARVYHVILRSAFGLRLHDVDCGFKLFRRDVIDSVVPQLESRAAFVSPELLIRAKAAGYRVVEVGVPHHPRVAGRPKGATPRVIARTLGEIARLRRSLRAGPASSGTSSGGR